MTVDEVYDSFPPEFKKQLMKERQIRLEQLEIERHLALYPKLVEALSIVGRFMRDNRYWGSIEAEEIAHQIKQVLAEVEGEK